MFASLLRKDLRCTLVLATRKVNMFLATSSLHVAVDVAKGTVGAQLKAIPSHCDGDFITDLRLLEIVDKDLVVILAAYSRGHFRAFDTAGRLLFAKRFADEPIHAIRIRTSNLPPQSGIFADQSSDLTLLYGSGVIVHITALALVGAIVSRAHLLAQGKPAGDDAPDLAHRKWRLTGCASILDVAVLGIHCREVLQLRSTSRSSSSSVASDGGGGGSGNTTLTTDIITVGENPSFALFDATADESSLSSALTAAQDAAAKLTSAVVGYARSWWSSAPATTAAADTASGANKKERFEPPSSVAMRCGVFDEPRRVQRIALSATGHLAATCDSLGRVALLDVQHLAIVKLWKGYRDAQLQWLLAPAGAAQYLLVHAPRRNQIEAWRTRHSSKPVATERIGRALLVRRSGAQFVGQSGHGESHRYAMMLRANGTIVLIGLNST
jgi:hypothetical protein